MTGTTGGDHYRYVSKSSYTPHSPVAAAQGGKAIAGPSGQPVVAISGCASRGGCLLIEYSRTPRDAGSSAHARYRPERAFRLLPGGSVALGSGDG